jgi:protoporphyrin/coproporphyrin ferrochelatase
MTTGVVVMAYGAPASREELRDYYTDIRRGRPPSDEQLAQLAARYDAISHVGDLSPLAGITRSQAATLAAALDRLEPGAFAVEVGMKHAAPRVEDAVAELLARGVDRLVGIVMAPHYSALSVGEYVNRLRAAAADTPVAAVTSWATEPAYVEFLATRVAAQLADMPANTKVLFTAHSLPERVVAMGDPYPDELRATATAVGHRLGLGPWSAWALAWQSAGRTPEPWLGPDVLAVIDSLAASENAAGVIVCPCGFVADHLEVLYDLDIEARARAEGHGLAFARTASLNADPTVFEALAARVASTR